MFPFTDTCCVRPVINSS